MERAYSLDLRQKVIDFVTQGGSKRQESRIFGIGEDTVYRRVRHDKEGKLAPKKRLAYPQKVDCEALLAYVTPPDHTLKEIAQAFQIGIKTA
jgi:transposase